MKRSEKKKWWKGKSLGRDIDSDREDQWNMECVGISSTYPIRTHSKHFLCVDSLSPHNRLKVYCYHLKMKLLGLRDFKFPAPQESASKWWSLNLNPGYMAPSTQALNLHSTQKRIWQRKGRRAVQNRGEDLNHSWPVEGMWLTMGKASQNKYM